MRIIDYKYITGTEESNGIIKIPGLHREKPATPQFMEMVGMKIPLTEPTAFIYINGTTVHQSEAGLSRGIDQFVPAIKTSSPYIAHQWLSIFENHENLVHMEVVNGTCASAIQAIYRAHQLVNSMFIKEVVILGHERICPDTVRLFKELGVRITCGDGFVYMRLEQGYEITAPIWDWAYNPNPFMFTREDLDTLIPDYRIGYVKLHGTGTPSNTAAEQGLEELATPLRYKHVIGHTQGISALLETCLILDNPNIRGRILVTANGLGGYYGSFTMTKPNAERN